MKMLFKEFLIIPVGLITAILIYPILHESGHILCAEIFNADVVEFNLMPLPNILCNISDLTDTQRILVGISGPVYPFVLASFFKPNGFWGKYIKTIIIGINILAFSLSIIAFIFETSTLTEQDDYFRAFSMTSFGKEIGLILSVIPIAVSVLDLRKMKCKKTLFEYFEIG